MTRVYFQSLQQALYEAMPRYHAYLHHFDVEYAFCVRVDIQRHRVSVSPDDLNYVDASDTDTARWTSATEAFERGLFDIFYPTFHTMRWRNKRLQVLCRRFRDVAGDLTALVDAQSAQISQRHRDLRERGNQQRRQQQERQERLARQRRWEQEQNARAQSTSRAEAMVGAREEPVWGYVPRRFDPYLRGGRVSVYLVPVEAELPGPERGYSERGVTVVRVVAALDRLWADDPDMQVIWPEQTELALVEWYRRERREQPSPSAAKCWTALTGQPVTRTSTGAPDHGAAGHTDFGSYGGWLGPSI